MAPDSDSNASGGEQPKKSGFDISTFLKPVVEVDTVIGKLFLFRLRDEDVRAAKGLQPGDAIARIREFLPCIASLSAEYSRKQQRAGITADQVRSLPDQEVERLAESYALSNALRSARDGGKGREPVIRGADEPATSFLDRLLCNEVEEKANQLQKLIDRSLGATSSIFDQVRKASQALGDTRLQFERLVGTGEFSGFPAQSIDTRSLDFSNPMAEYNARLTRERAEDREMIRLTGQMSAQSAKTLQELADAASTLLDGLDQRDKDAKKTTRVQLWIAVGSVVVSALLAGAAYYQDWRNNKSGDEWQGKVLAALSVANARTATLEAENQVLRLKMDRLGSTLADLGRRPLPPTAKTGGAAP
jgi:hypothetical protein